MSWRKLAIKKQYAAHQSDEDWFCYYTDRWALHGHEDSMHMALWYYLLILEKQDA